jgi:4-hydroxy-3-polyprenylbenzoate decarboxylase
VCHRETPLNLIDIENMRTLALAGAIVCPTNPGFYLNPNSVEEIVDFIVGKVLDLLKVEHDLRTRWEHQTSGPSGVDTSSSIAAKISRATQTRS